MRTRLVVMGLLPLVTAACATTWTTSTTLGDAGGPPAPERHGRVEWVRETVQHREGNPAGGAAAGAVIGGILGHAILGRGGGTLIGAVGGAAAGASASQGSAESSSCDVEVRFDDGSLRVYRHGGRCAYRPGDAVSWSRQGLRPAARPDGEPLHAPPGPPPPYAPPGPPPSDAPGDMPPPPVYVAPYPLPR